MINISEIINSGRSYEKILSKLFKKAEKSKIKFIRLATHFNEISQTVKICKILKNKKFKVIINLMQITEQKPDDITAAVKLIKTAKPSVLYFADSLGAMNTEDVSKCIKSIRTHWSGEIGIHTHNNLGKAVSNSISAIQNGATWIDSTVTGMGRGPGNSETEYILIEMSNFSKKNITCFQ